MRVAITGGTGFVGAHTVSRARAAGHEVRMLVRNPAKAARMRDMFDLSDDGGIELAEADLTDHEALAAGLAGCDAAIHIAALFSLDPRQAASMERINPEAATTIIATGQRLGLDPIVYMSTIGVYQPPPSPFVTADDDLAPGCGPYTRSKIAAERIARAAQDDGAPVVCVYPGGIFGPRDPNESLSDSVAVIRDIMKWKLATIPKIAAMPFVDVRDVADLCVAALEPDRGPRRYLLPGHQTQLRDLVRLCKELTGRYLPLVPAPRPMLTASGRVADSLARRFGVQMPLSSETVALMEVGMDHPDATYDQGPATRDFGLPTRELRETLRDTLVWLADAGHLRPNDIGHLARP